MFPINCYRQPTLTLSPLATAYSISPTMAPVTIPSPPKPFALPPPAAGLNGLSEDTKISATILFPVKQRGGSLGVRSDPRLDVELERLKLSILSQQPMEISKKLPFYTVHEPIRNSRKTPLQNSTEQPVDRSLPTERARIGMYTPSERAVKLRRYKEKMRRRRAVRPVSRVYKGRKVVALKKQRVNGRFVSSKGVIIKANMS